MLSTISCEQRGKIEKNEEVYMKHQATNQNRRTVIGKMTGAGLILPFGCKALLAKDDLFNAFQEDIPKYQTNADMTYEQVFNFAFRNWYIRYMKGLQAEIGKDKFLEMIKHVGWKSYADSVRSGFEKITPKNVSNFIAQFWAPMSQNRLWSHTIPVEIIKQTPTEGVVRMKECLVAKTFLENDAADIGYAAICHADFAVIDTFNPNIRLIRNQCLMNGDDSCYFEYSLKS